MYIIAHRGVGASFCARASVRSYIPVHVIFCNKCHLSLEGDPSEIIAVLKEQAAGRGMDALASMLQDVIKHRRTEIGMSSPRVCHVPYSGRPPPLRPSERAQPCAPRGAIANQILSCNRHHRRLPERLRCVRVPLCRSTRKTFGACKRS